MLQEEREEKPWDLFRQGLGLPETGRIPPSLRSPRNLMSSAVMLKVPEAFEEKYPVKYTCTALVTCWHLAWLGVEPFVGLTSKLERFSDTPFPASKAVTVLPLEYLTVESYAIQIIRNLDDPSISKLWKNLEYVFTGSVPGGSTHAE